MLSYIELFKLLNNIDNPSKVVIPVVGHWCRTYPFQNEFHTWPEDICNICNQQEIKMLEVDPDKFLYVINDSEDDSIFIIARTILEAVDKWKTKVADEINSDISNPAERITVDEVGDPNSVQLIGEPGSIIL